MTMNAKKEVERRDTSQIINPTSGQQIPLSSLPFTARGTVVVPEGFTLDFITRRISLTPGNIKGPWLQIPPRQINTSVSPATWWFQITIADCPHRGTYVLEVTAYVTKAGHQSQVQLTPVTFGII
jgi:hypothetical protein